MCGFMMVHSRFQFDFDWDDPDDKFAPEDETWKADKAAQLRGVIHTWMEGPCMTIFPSVELFVTCERSSASQWLTLAWFEEQEVVG